jgi:hypothetical protein
MGTPIVASRCLLCKDKDPLTLQALPFALEPDLTGQAFSQLTVQHCAGMGRWRVFFWCCLCACGTTILAKHGLLLGGRTQSCGGPAHDDPNTQKKRHRRLKVRWRMMIDRCHNPYARDYPSYGGRGITVCEQWRTSFQAFIEDMGYPPPSMSLERRDNNAGYTPANCCWATNIQQVRNQRSNRLVTLNNETHPLTEWAEIKGIKVNVIYVRLGQGWTIEEALTYPYGETPLEPDEWKAMLLSRQKRYKK